jgi:hypothetical protein
MRTYIYAYLHIYILWGDFKTRGKAFYTYLHNSHSQWSLFILYRCRLLSDNHFVFAWRTYFNIFSSANLLMINSFSFYMSEKKKHVLLSFSLVIDFRLVGFFGFLVFWWYWGLNSGLTPWATPPALFCVVFFQDRVSQTICTSWLQTEIYLISASWVAGITGMSHRHLSRLQFSVLHSPQIHCCHCEVYYHPYLCSLVCIPWYVIYLLSLSAFRICSHSLPPMSIFPLFLPCLLPLSPCPLSLPLPPSLFLSLSSVSS